MPADVPLNVNLFAAALLANVIPLTSTWILFTVMGAVSVGAEATVNLALSPLALTQTAPAVSQAVAQNAFAAVSQFPVPPQGVVAPLTSQNKVAARSGRADIAKQNSEMAIKVL